jgi:hypothetical protein
MPRVSAFYGVVILANWERARKNEQLIGIPPLP